MCDQLGKLKKLLEINGKSFKDVKEVQYGKWEGVNYKEYVTDIWSLVEALDKHPKCKLNDSLTLIGDDFVVTVFVIPEWEDDWNYISLKDQGRIRKKITIDEI